ncbi:MAG: HlyD family type I secretion periplasmic adaptor subunit [Marinovum sp.]|nr:HlyD family type I secretion periplasmic adaptor subunit [Marinovum sp.]
MVKLSQEVRHANSEIAELQTQAVSGQSDRSEGFEIEEEQTHDDVDDTDAIYYTPPSRLLIYAASIIFILFVVAFSFASTFEIDTTVSSRGKFATKVPNVDIQATSNAIVKKVTVERGQTLREGQVVAILDDTNARTNLAQNTETLASVKDRLLRIKLEQDHLKTGKPLPVKISLSDLLKDILRKRIDQYRSKLSSFSSRIEKLRQETNATKQEIMSAQETVRITKKQTELKRRIEGARKQLYDRQNGSLLSYLQAQDATLGSERSYYDARNQLALKKAALAAKVTDLSVLEADKEEFTAQWSSSLGEQRSKEEEKRVQLSQEAVKLRRDMRNVEVRASVEGIVLDLPKVTSGSIVREGDVIATLVRTNQPLTLEVDISPKDISDARLGADVSVKLDALPFQQYGDLKGKLSYLSQDTYEESLDGEKGAFYRGRVKISVSELASLPKDFQLTSGMTASADMKVGKRRLITYLLFPIIKGLSQSFTEPD